MRKPFSSNELIKDAFLVALQVIYTNLQIYSNNDDIIGDDHTQRSLTGNPNVTLRSENIQIVSDLCTRTFVITYHRTCL